MSDMEESTPIQDVLEIEQSHSADAEKVLAELNGISGNSSPSVGGVSPPPSNIHTNPGIDTDDVIEEEDDMHSETMMDFWIQLAMTVVTVTLLVFLFFSPKIRILLEPMIGSGYMSLGIRSLIIGFLSPVPRLLLM